MSHPDHGQWFGLLDELDRLARQIREQSAVVRAREVESPPSGVSGYPAASPGFGERGSVHAPLVDIEGNVIAPDPNDLPPAHADLTGERAAAAADGHIAEDDALRHRRAGERLSLEAVERLRRAFGEFMAAVPGRIPDPQREQCASCFISKDVATKYGQRPGGWVVSEGKCESCVKRLVRQPTRSLDSDTKCR